MFLFYQFVMEKVGVMEQIVRQKDFEIFMTMELSPLFNSDEDLVEILYNMLRHHQAMVRNNGALRELMPSDEM